MRRTTKMKKTKSDRRTVVVGVNVDGCCRVGEIQKER